MRLAVLLLVGGAGLLIYLQYRGVPDWAKDRWVAGLESRRIYVDADRITFSLFQGLVARGFHYYDTPHRALPMMEAEDVELEMDPLAWLAGRSVWTGLGVHNAIVRFSTQGTLAQASPDGLLVIKLTLGRLRLDGDWIEVRDLRASIPGLEVIGQGRIRLDTAPAGPVDDDLAGPRRSSEAPWNLAGGPGWLTGLIRRLNEIDIEPALAVGVTFDIDMTDLSASDVTLSGEGGQTTIRRVAFDEWKLTAVYRERKVFVETLLAAPPDGVATIGGSFDVDRGTIAGRASSSLPPSHWTNLIPVSWRNRLDAAGVVLAGGAVRFTLDVGPVSLSTFWTQCTGTVETERVKLRDVWIERSRFEFASENEKLEMTDVDVVIGQAAHQGALAGRFAFDRADRGYQGHLESDMDYVALIPVLGDKWVRLIRSTEFGDRPPHAIADFSGRAGDPEAFVLDGTFEASDFKYRTTYVDHLTTGILSSNRVLTLAPLYGELEDGDVDGRLIRIDFRERRVDLDLTSHADPKAMGRVATERLERILRPFTFDGSTDVDVKGSVYLGTNGVTDVRATAKSTLLGLWSFVADEVSLDLVWTGRHVNITDIAARIYGGTLTGAFAVYPDTDEDHALRYALDMKASGVRFLDVVRTLAQKEGEEYRGNLGGRLRLTGNLGPDQGRSATGSGTIRIEDGRIMMIPLFGPLSRGLSKILPGLGFTKQTDLTASFDIADGHIRSDNAKLLGTMFSLDAAGVYSIKGKGLDFDVELVLLGDGLVGEVVQFVTSPISKLSEFDLEGTLGAPQWRPKNLPRELFTDAP